jgi:hypothetical protein
MRHDVPTAASKWFVMQGDSNAHFITVAFIT